jgi:addiction module HigA family antidote
MARKMPPIHPGEILLTEFLEPLGISQYRASKALGVPQPRISAITRGERGISADTALRLARFLRTTPEFWTNLQAHYDLEIARDALGSRGLEKIQPFKDELDSAEPRKV